MSFMPIEQHTETRQPFFRDAFPSLGIPRASSDRVRTGRLKSIERIFNATEIVIVATERSEMSEKRGRGQPKFEPTRDQRS
jgi:hypothetical protein